MRKLVTNVVTILLMGMLVLVSCAGPENDPNAVGVVKFVSGGTRGLDSVFDGFEVESLFWKYEAKKIEIPNANFGQTNGPTFIHRPASEGATPATPDKGLKFTIGPFTAGTWEFKLYGYKSYDKDTHDVSHPVYEGTVIQQILPNVNNPVVVPVNMLEVADSKGTVKANTADIKFVNKITDPVTGEVKTEVIPKQKNSSIRVYLTKVGSSEILYDSTSSSCVYISADPGEYMAHVEYVESTSKVPFARAELIIHVYTEITTLIKGDLPTLTGESSIYVDNTKYDTGLDGEVIASTKTPVEVVADKSTTLVVGSTLVNPKDTKNYTIIDVPAGAIAAKSNVAVAVKTAGTKPNFEVSSGNTVLGKLDIDVFVNDVETHSFIENAPVKVTTNIGTGLPENVIVRHNTNDGQSELIEDTVYDPLSGRLEFTTTSFSSFDIMTKYNIQMGNNFYVNVGDISASDYDKVNVNTIKILNDFSASGWFEPRYTTVIDLNGHTITDDRLAHKLTSSHGFIQGISSRTSNITIKDSVGGGKILSDGNRAIILADGKHKNTLTIEGGYFGLTETVKADSPLIYFFGDIPASGSTPSYKDGGTLNIKGGVFNSGDNTLIISQGNDQCKNTLNVEGAAELTGNWYIPSFVTVNIKGGKFSNKGTIIYQKAGVLNVDGGEFTVTGGTDNWMHWGSGALGTGDAIIVEACGNPAGNPSMVITDKAKFNMAAVPENVNIVTIKWNGNYVTTTGTTVPYYTTAELTKNDIPEAIYDKDLKVITNLDQAKKLVLTEVKPK